MPFKAAAVRVFQHFVGQRTVNCTAANEDERLEGYFAQWTTDPYGKESTSPSIAHSSDSSKGRLTFLKKNKTIKATKTHKGGILTKTIVCHTRNQQTQCCVGKNLKANRLSGEDNAALTPALQLW
jgi:hypothetical protein